MGPFAISYRDPAIKQLVDDWGYDKGLVATDQIALHLEERFHVAAIDVVAAVDQGDFLILQITTDRWQEPREFGLLSDGSLSW
jgi:hypothetical protein